MSINPRLRTNDLPFNIISQYLRMSDPADLVENTKTSLKILQSLGEAIPGGGIVKCISGIGLALVETAQVGLALRQRISLVILGF